MTINRLDYMQKWREENREHLREYQTKWKRLNKLNILLHSIRNRCQNTENKSFKNYGARGIKCYLSPKELAFMWLRDGADLMKRPTIDRIDNNGHYTFENCRFIEHSENCQKRWMDTPYHDAGRKTSLGN